MAADFKVQLEGPDGLVVFEASAVVPEARTSNYDTYGLVHMPVDLYAYKNTTSRRFNVTAKLVSRTAREANYNSEVLYFIRKWILPDFGRTGAPPPILKFSAYANRDLTRLPVVITDYGWTFDEQTDYIFDGVAEPMPVIGTLNVGLVEIYSAADVTDLEWEIIPGGGGSFGGPSVNEVSDSAIFSFGGGGASGLFDAISGGGGFTSGGGFISSDNSPFLSDMSLDPNLSRNPFVIGPQLAGAANGVLNSVANVSALVDPSSGLAARVASTALDPFSRVGAALSATIPGITSSLDDDV